MPDDDQPKRHPRSTPRQSDARFFTYGILLLFVVWWILEAAGSGLRHAFGISRTSFFLGAYVVAYVATHIFLNRQRMRDLIIHVFGGGVLIFTLLTPVIIRTIEGRSSSSGSEEGEEWLSRFPVAILMGLGNAYVVRFLTTRSSSTSQS